MAWLICCIHFTTLLSGTRLAESAASAAPLSSSLTCSLQGRFVQVVSSFQIVSPEI